MKKFTKIPDDKFAWLINSFTKEVRDTLFDIDPFKAPSRHGMNDGFYKNLWGIMGEAVSNFVLEFYKTGILPQGIINTLLNLILKAHHLETINQLRPERV